MKILRKTMPLLLLAVMAISSPPKAAGNAGRIKVLTFNVWCVLYDAEQRTVRSWAMGKRIARLNPDIVAFQEVFEPRHRKILLKSLEENGYPTKHWKYYRRMYGSGLLVVSRFPIVRTGWEHFVANGGYHDIEWAGGKGVGYVNLETPWGPLDFFLTHAVAQLDARYNEDWTYAGGDVKLTDRLLQMYQIDRVVRKMRAKSGRSIIAAGDFNVSLDMLEYKFLMALTGFENSFDYVNPGSRPSTYARENVFVGGDEGRIDHIFFKNYDGTVGFKLKPVVSRIEMKGLFKSPKTGEMINYSDHYGVWTEFEVVTDGKSVDNSPDGIGVIIPAPTEKLALSNYGANYGAGRIDMGSDSADKWRDLALNIYEKAYRKHERANPLLIPMAQVIVKSSTADRSIVTIGLKHRNKFEKIIR